MPTDDTAQVPDVAGVRDGVRSELVRFVRALRRADVDVSANAAVVAGRALVEVGFDDEERGRAALRAVLVTRPTDIERFDRMFGEFWQRLTAHLSGNDPAAGDGEDGPSGRLASLGDTEIPELDAADGDTTDGDEPRDSDGNWSRGLGGGAGDAEADEDETVTTATYSPGGRPERVSVSLAPAFEDAESTLARSVGRLSRAVATERGRRWESADEGEKTDVRRALRRSVATGGTVVSVPERRRTQTASRVLVLADVSQSVLDVLDRSFLLRWLRTLRAETRSCRVFLFDNDVREVTAAFDAGTTRAVVDALRDAETAWGGGTRIGHAVTTIREEYADAVDRRTAVFVVSDGLEMGDVSSLESGMAWLSRRAMTVLWLNPLAGAPEYEPTAAGIAAALPSVDGLFAFSGPADSAEIARQLTRYGHSGAVGYEHDPRRKLTTQP